TRLKLNGLGIIPEGAIGARCFNRKLLVHRSVPEKQSDLVATEVNIFRGQRVSAKPLNKFRILAIENAASNAEITHLPAPLKIYSTHPPYPMFPERNR
ncbi:hypothetical protein, partial [Marinobacter sp.]|uniref:hypothetical protein n=1 Tax=Marinobacter sp. TaxID=50741 RepID=UPI00262D1457